MDPLAGVESAALVRESSSCTSRLPGSVIRSLVQQKGAAGVDEERALRESLGHRLLRFEHGDRAAVLGPAAGRAARDLLSQALGTTAEGRSTLAVVDVYLLGQFHWYRYQVLPPGKWSAEVEPIRQYFAGMVTRAPEHVPEVCASSFVTNRRIGPRPSSWS